MNFIRKLNRAYFYFLNQNFQICWLIRGREVIKNTKYQFNISKFMLAMLKPDSEMCVNTTIDLGLSYRSLIISNS